MRKKKRRKILKILSVISLILAGLLLMLWMVKNFEGVYARNLTRNYPGENLSRTDNWLIENHSLTREKDTLPLFAAIIIALTGGIIMGVYMLLIFPSVDVYTYDLANKRRKIGQIILFKNGEEFFGRINESISEKSETGRYELCFANEFVESNRNKIVVIRLFNRAYSEIVKPVICIKERRVLDGAYFEI